MCQLCDSSWGSWVLRQCDQDSGELSDKYTTAVYVFAKMEGEIVDVNVGLN